MCFLLLSVNIFSCFAGIRIFEYFNNLYKSRLILACVDAPLVK